MAEIGLSAFSLFFMRRSRFSPISVRSKKDARPPIAILCSAWRKFPTTITSVRCLIPSIPHIYNPRSIKWLRRCAGRHEGIRAPWRPRADRPRRNRIFLLAKARLPALPNAQAFERQDRIFTIRCWRRRSSPGPQHGRAADARVHRQAGRRRETRLRPQCRQALARRASRARRSCAPSISATICSPASRSAKPCWRAAPLRDGKDALSANWIGLATIDAKGKTTYEGVFVTSHEVSRETVAEIAACARARGQDGKS